MTEAMNTDLSGKRAIVTGASRGIGEAIAGRLATAGAQVALVSRRREGLEDVASRLDTETMVVTANMSRSEEIAAIVPAVTAKWGGVDILVNNAGTNPVFGPIVEIEEPAWDKTFDTNLKGPFLLAKAAAAEMEKAGGGAIVNIASTGGLEPSPMLGAYSVSKAAIIMLTKVLAVELGRKAIRVNCIAPGLVDTKFASVLVNTPSIHDAYVARAALGRHGQPEEIAGAALYLVSSESSFMTGQVLVIDGGTRF